jgi:hypothetical protein
MLKHGRVLGHPPVKFVSVKLKSILFHVEWLSD